MQKTSIVVSVLAFVLMGTTHGEIRYTVIDVSELGGYQTRPVYINNLGQMAGMHRLPSDSLSSLGHAFFYDGSSMIDLLPGEFGAFESSITGLNDLGHVIGNARNQPHGTGSIYGYPFSFDGATIRDLTPQLGESLVTDINVHRHIVGHSAAGRAFLYDGTNMHDIGDAGGLFSGASAVNDHGHVVGEAGFDNGNVHAFFYSSDTGMRDLGAFGNRFSRAFAVNNAGQVVGDFTIDVDDHPDTPEFAFMWTVERGMITLPGGINSSAYAINDTGEVVGMSHLGLHTASYAWYFDGIRDYDLNTLIDPASGWRLAVAYDINNLGQIVGLGEYDPDGPGGVWPTSRAFLLTPIPEPSAIALLLMGVMSLRRHR